VDHVRYVEGFIDALGLENITLVIHHWGSALGFHYAMRNESNVKGIALMEALLMPIPSVGSMPVDMREMFQAFRTPEVGWDMIVNQNMFLEQLVPGMVVRTLKDV
jgi:haloalkane dehalogenase